MNVYGALLDFFSKNKRILLADTKSLKIEKVSTERNNISCSLFPLGTDQ